MAKRILVIEDDNAVADLVEMILTDAGYHVERLMDAGDGLHNVQASRPDLVLLDLTLVGMSGQAFFRSCKTDPMLASLPIVVMSGTDVTRSSWEDEVMPDAVLPKPFDIDVLCTVVGQLVDEPARLANGAPA